LQERLSSERRRRIPSNSDQSSQSFHSRTSSMSSSDRGRNSRDAEVERLRKELEEERAKRQKLEAVTPGKVANKEVPEDVGKVISIAVNKHIWCWLPFFPEAPTDAKKWKQKIYTSLRPPDDTNFGVWSTKYGDYAVSCINETRSYHQGEVKKVCEAYYEENGDTMPDVDLLKACATRDIDLTIEANRTLFIWYWDVLLPCVTGRKNKTWKEEIRRYNLIMDGERSVPWFKTPKKCGYITPQQEAFACVCIENMLDNWTNLLILDKHPDRKGRKVSSAPKDLEDKAEKYLGRKLTPEDRAKQYVKAVNKKKNQVIWTFGNKFRGKYSVNDGGSSLTSGWSDEGKQVFTDLAKLVKAARARPDCREAEEYVLELVKKKHDLVANSHAEEVAMNRKKTDPVLEKHVKDMVQVGAIDSDDENDLVLVGV